MGSARTAGLRETGHMTTTTGPRAQPRPPGPGADLAALEEIQRRVLWLSTAIVHHANAVRPNASGLKVGGH